MSGYETVLGIVAENPGIDTGEFREVVSDLGGDRDATVELLEQAVRSADVVEADGKYWIVRKGKYSK
jgi:hypothetical protein